MSDKHDCPRCNVKFECKLKGCKLPEKIICDVCYSHEKRHIMYLLRGRE